MSDAGQDPPRDDAASMPRVELRDGTTIPRLIKGGWQLAGGHGAVDETRAIAMCGWTLGLDAVIALCIEASPYRDADAATRLRVSVELIRILEGKEAPR